MNQMRLKWVFSRYFEAKIGYLAFVFKKLCYNPASNMPRAEIGNRHAPDEQLRDALKGTCTGDMRHRAFENVGMWEAAQSKSRLTLVGRLRLGLTETKINKELDRASGHEATYRYHGEAERYDAAKPEATSAFQEFWLS